MTVAPSLYYKITVLTNFALARNNYGYKVCFKLKRTYMKLQF
jgi:hypothetical protein